MQSNFPNITNNLALNFLNSKLTHHGKVIDLINSKNSLKNWSEIPYEKNSEYNLQLSIFNSSLDKIEDISKVIAFRDYLQNLLFDIISQRKTIANLKMIIETNLVNNPLSVIFVGNQPMFVPVKDGLEGVKSIVFLSLINLIESNEIETLSHCSNSECFSLFPNKSGRRKWCSMKICGNRNKVEQYGKRQKKKTID